MNERRTIVAGLPGPENLLDQIRSSLDTLRKSDRKVAEVLLDDPERILRATVAETAELAQVSQPTVMRFANAMGCDGFQDMKLRLARCLAVGTSATHSALSETDETKTIVEKIFDYTIASLDWARRSVDPDQIERAVEMLVTANRIEFFGHGASGIVAQDAQQKFPLFGVPCGAQADSHQQIMAACMLGNRDVAVVISNTGMTASVLQIARLARENGAGVIGISGSQSPLLELCDAPIVVETLDNTDIFTPTISRIGALVVMDILSTAVALRRLPAQHDRIIAMKKVLMNLRSSRVF